MTDKIKHHETTQFRNVCKLHKERAQWVGYDDEGNAVKDFTKTAEVIDYEGTVKLHGTHVHFVLKFPRTCEVYNKKGLRLGVYGGGVYTADSPAAGGGTDSYSIGHTACTVYGNEFSDFISAVEYHTLRKLTHRDYNGEVHEGDYRDYLDRVECSDKTIIISGEWAGEGIQKGVAISSLPKKFYMFGVKVGDEWISSDILKGIPDIGIFINLWSKQVYTKSIDFGDPSSATNDLVDLTNEVERQCPIGALYGVEGIGEGIVWMPKDPELRSNTGTWFKVKGAKHSVSRVKTLASVDPEKQNSIKEFVEYSATYNRLNQGVQEVGLDIKLTGDYVRWVIKDIYKEESDVIKASGLNSKEINPALVNAARLFYVNLAKTI